MIKYILRGVVGIIILSIFLLSSGVVNPSWNPFIQPPSGEVLETAIYNLSKIEKMRIFALVDLSIETSKKITGVLNLNQAIDYSNKIQKKNLTDFNLSVGIEGVELSIQAQMIGIDKNLYLKIISLPEYLPLGVDVETIKNQWLLIDSIFASTSQDIKNIQDTAFLNDIKAFIANKNLFKLKRNLGQGHYAAQVDKQTAKEIIPQIFAVINKRLSNDSYQQDLQQSLSEFQQNFDEIWKAFGGLNFEVWIDEKNQILEKIKFAKEIQQNKIGIELAFTDFNKDIIIEQPVDFKPIQDVLPPDLLGK